MNVNVPASEPAGPPDTGASTNDHDGLVDDTNAESDVDVFVSIDEHSRNSLCLSRTLDAARNPLVELVKQSWTCGARGSIVTMMSACSATALGVSTTVTECSASATNLSRRATSISHRMKGRYFLAEVSRHSVAHHINADEAVDGVLRDCRRHVEIWKNSGFTVYVHCDDTQESK